MGTQPPNSMFGPGSNRGSSNQPSGPSPYTAGRGSIPTGDRFNVGAAKMPQPPSAVEPGKGSIPVNPWNQQGGPASVEVSIPDMAGIAKPPK